MAIPQHLVPVRQRPGGRAGPGESHRLRCPVAGDQPGWLQDRRGGLRQRHDHADGRADDRRHRDRRDGPGASPPRRLRRNGNRNRNGNRRGPAGRGLLPAPDRGRRRPGHRLVYRARTLIRRFSGSGGLFGVGRRCGERWLPSRRPRWRLPGRGDRRRRRGDRSGGPRSGSAAGQDPRGQPVGLVGGRRMSRDQFGQELVGGGPAGRVGRHAPRDDGPELGGQVAEPRRGEQHPLLAHRGRAGSVGSLARRRERQDRAEAEDVAGRPDRVAHCLLGRHEPGGADHRAGQGHLGEIRGLGDAEVDQPGAVRRQQHVRRLQVTVDDARLMDGGQALGQAGRQGEHRGQRQRTVLLDRVGQRRAPHVAGDQPGHDCIGVGVDHRRGKGAADPARGLDLPREPRPEVPVPGQIRPDDLDRNLASAD